MSEYAKLVISVDSTQAKKADKDLGALEKSASNLSSGLGKLLGPLASVATAMAALNKASDVQRQFDVLNAGLITATGSSAEAAKAFQALQQFAQKTPYDLNQAVKGFTQLVNLGLTPSEKALTSYGNTASAMGKDLNQMIEAVADAATGEFERLKEFGIKAKVSGDQVSLIFQGVTTKVGNNAKEIEGYLIGLGELKFGDAMALRMATFDGAVSNLADTWENTFRLINEAGLGDAMRSAVNEAAEALNELNDQIGSGQLEANLDAIASKFDGFGRDVAQSIATIQQVWLDATSSDSRGGMAFAGQETVQFLIDAFRNLPENVRAMIQVMTVEVLAGFDTVKAYARAFNDGINAIFTGDTFEGVGARLEAELNVASEARKSSIVSIIDERDAALTSFADQTRMAGLQRDMFEESQTAARANTSDRLAQYKALGDSAKQQSEADKKAAKEAEQLAKQQAKALKELLAQNEISVSSSNAMTDAYLAGADSVRELTIQQKIEEELLKTGAAARDAVTSAVNREVTAKDRLDIAQSIANMRVEVTQTLAQATATLQGKAALEAFNIQKSMSVALSGKNIEYGSKEYELLLQQTKAQLEANKALEQASSVESIVDRLNPQIKLLKDYTAEQEALNAAIARYPENAALYQDALVKLGNEYQVNQSKATIWGQLTEGAVDRIDGVFADAWANIGSGADSLWDNLVKGAKQAFGEIAHMLTTKPLLASISNWLTGTDNGQGLSAVWGKLLGSAGGSSGGTSGGGLFSGLAGVGQNLLSAWNTITGVGSSVATGYASGGIGGAISGGAGYYGNMLNGIATTLSSGFTSLIGGNIAITGATAAASAATTAALTGVTAEVAAGAAATVGAEGITVAALQGAIAEGAATVGTQIGVAGATTAAASSGIGASISAAMSSAAAMWPLAIVMGMYQSGKLYSAGVRPDGDAIQASGGDTALGKAAMFAPAMGARWLEMKDNILSKVVGGKLAAIITGSTFFQAVYEKVGSKLFGSSYQTKDTGIQLGVEDGQFDAGGYIKQKKKKGLISGSSKTRYLESALDPQVEESLGAAYNEKILNSMGLFSALGVQLSDAVLDGLDVAVTRISTDGRSQEDIQKDLDAWFTSLGNSAVAAISDATNSGVANYTFDELTTFTNNLYSINDMFKLLNINALPVTVWGGKLTEQYVAMAGGMEALQSAATSYYNAFFSETERADDTLAAVRAQFKSLNLTLPDTAPGFRAMVEGIDSTTDSGRAMYIQLMGLSSSAASAYTILESRAKEAEAASDAASQAALDAAQAVKDALLGVVSNASSGVSRAVEAERDAATKAYNTRVASLNEMSATAAQSVTDLSTVSNSLESALKSLNGTSDDAVKTLRAQAQATLQSALATARAGGSLAGFTGLEDALSTVSDNNTDLYSSMEDFARDQGRTANVVAELNAINGKQLTAAEKLQEGLETQIDQAKEAYDAQMAQYDQQLAFAQAQMDALNGVDTSVMSVTAAINAMNSAVVAALAGIGGKASAGTSTNNGTLINSVYQDVLGRGADAAGAAYWQGQLASGAIGYDQLEQAIKNAAVANGSIPAYATGGDHMGGLRLVGENGPELEVTGPSRIFNANQTAAMLKGGGGNNSNLEQKVDVLIDVVKQIVGPMKLNSDADSKLFKKWDRVGLPTIAVGA
ncbi:DUF4214 domain-containing protein [Pseudomonas caspiana]